MMNIQEEFEEWFLDWDTNYYSLFELPSRHLVAKESWNGCAELMQKEIDRLKEEIEVERMKLAACGVVALANTPESAAEQRKMSEEYKSASLDAVISAVDREIKYREELAALRRFANKAILYSYNVRSETETKIILDAEKFGLIDEVTGNPTTLIKGE